MATAISRGGDQSLAQLPATTTRSWPQKAAVYRASSTTRGTIQLGTTLIPLAILFTLMYASLSVSYWLTLALAPLAAGFHIRTFIIMHDCAHGSFLPSKRANEVVGFLTGLITLTAFAQWRRDHALHHASSGDLDRRGHGDILTLTVDEYLAKDRWGRLRYRAYRHPLVLFGLGPLYLCLLNRWHTPGSGAKWAHIAGVHAANVAIALVALALAKTIGLGAFLLVYAPVHLISGAAGIWLFYVQHQFEGTYWRRHEEWDYASAALHGSSYYRLPRVLEWMTGGIGLHHVHHLDPRIPNYHLRRCHDGTSEFRDVPELRLRQSLRSVSLRLWDADQGRLVGWEVLRARGRVTDREGVPTRRT